MRVLVRTFGCSTNQADGQVIAGCLREAGNEIVNSISNADIVIYNTCAVKGPTENRMLALAARVPREKKLIITGCLPLINRPRIEKEVRYDGLAGPAIGKKIVSITQHVSAGETVLAFDDLKKEKPGLALPRLETNRVVSIVPICYGCLGSCSYCGVVFARGRLRSYSIEEVISRVKADVEKGFREFWLTAQDTAAYGRDIGTNLPNLLGFVSAVDGDFRIRVGMMTPNQAFDILDDLVSVFEHEKIFKFLHLPVQSGDDQTLKRMKRFYTVSEFKKIIRKFRSCFPRITFSTDIISGFPGETVQAFENTIDLINQTKPDIVNVSKFFARPGTAAGDMDSMSLSRSEIKVRTVQIERLAKKTSLDRNVEWVGWRGNVLVDEVGKVQCSWVGRNYAYKPIVIKSPKDLLGKTFTVEVLRANTTFLEGQIVA